MKLLRVIPSVDLQFGGPAEAARRFDSELQHLGHTVEVASLDAMGAPHLSGYPAKVHALGNGTGGYGYSSALSPWIKANHARFDAVLVDGLWQYHGLATWRAMAGSKVPYFIFTHGMLDPWFKRQYPIKHLKKWLYWPWAEYRLLRDAKAVLFTCEEERLLARQSFWLYRANEVVTAFGTSDVPQDAPSLRGAFVDAFPALQGKRLALFLGRLHEKKGADLLIEAFAQTAAADPRLHLVMAGPEAADWGGHLRSLASRLGIAERVTWTGMLSGDLKWGAFYASEVFCLPSHQENFGIAVAEALACGKPVLISNKVNIWREIEQDGAGWIGNDTVDATATAMQQWLSAGAEDIQQRGRAARRCFERRFRLEQAVQSLLGIIGSELTDGVGAGLKQAARA